MPIIAPYGTWKSPIVTEWLTLGQKKFGTLFLEGEAIYWEEMRPSEKGRSVVVRYTPDGQIAEVTPPEMSVRSRVHEYGGGAFTVYQGKVYYVNDKDQRIYLGEEPLSEPGIRFADLYTHGSYLIAIGEKEQDNFIVSLHLGTKKWTKIASGNDFYASASLSPDGKQIAYLTWNHPQMPWDGTELWLGDFQEGQIVSPKKIAGGTNESIFQPQWSPTGTLHFVSDKTDWWNLYQWDGTRVKPLYSQEAECGLPQWVFGMSTYAFAGDKVVITSVHNGQWSLTLLPEKKHLELPWTYFTQIRAQPRFAVFIAGSATEGKRIVKLDLMTHQPQVVAKNISPHLDLSYISPPHFITYPSSQGRECHAFYYEPQNKEYGAPLGTLPPLLVMSHGGPTAQTRSTFDLEIQFWTSRGIAVLDVDYGGSTGYGRPYRDRLKGQWGVVDVQDCEAGVHYLVQQKKVDPTRVAIRGGSAGGFTTLAALAFGSTFTVGASYYGVSCLEDLAEQTHKFEARYLDGLIGPYPEKKELYTARSPLSHVDRLKCPVIFFQGAEDRVVPLNQAEKMCEALRRQGVTTELIVYEGEQHGFRRAENVKDALERELAFYLKVWGLDHLPH